MTTFRRFGRVQSLLALAVLMAGLLIYPASGFAGQGAKPKPKPAQAADTIPQLESSAKVANLPVLHANPTASKTASPRGELGGTVLNVDSVTEDATISFFTFGTDITVKLAFGNRFTLTNDQAPFALKQVSAVLVADDNGMGFEAGENVGVTVFIDPASTGNIANATPVFDGVYTLDQVNAQIVFGLPEPIIIGQGDVYCIVTDESTDSDDTLVPVVQAENINTEQDVPPVPTATSGYFPLSATGLVGNVFVRGFGDPASPDDNITGGGQTVNPDLVAPTNPMAVGSSQVTLSWTAPTLPAVSETEPNNSANGAQQVPFNQIINATVKTSDTGTDVGGGNFEDWFSFTLTEAAPVTVDLVDDGGVDIDIYLYPKAGPFATSIAQSAGDCGAHELIDGVQLQPGDYVVAIDAFDNPNCAAGSSTPYKLLIVGPGGVRLTGFNVYRGSSENFELNAESYFGTVGPSTTGFVIQESAVGAFYRITSVYGAEQSSATTGVTGTPCEGGPTFTSVKVKRSGAGAITLKGLSGSTTGLTIQINGVGFSSPPKIKVSKGTVKQKGPLANGQTVGQACPPGTVITILTASGCSTVTAP